MRAQFGGHLLALGGVFLFSFGLPGVAAEAAAGKVWPPSPSDKIVNISGNYPHLAVFNGAGECGIGAVAPWAGKLWFITYPPHFPEGSEDKLYSVDANLKLEMRPESVGGTHANRMIHRESGQLIIGPYFIGTNGAVRAADIRQMRARLTATARHLTDPANRVYFVGMERELYDVDVRSLAVTRIYGESGGLFPGTHGKGAYVSQGRLVVANNGERGWSFQRDPHFTGPAGCLAESSGRWKTKWTVIDRKNFCEVTGPGGLAGNAPNDDRLWATGWDKRSVILKLFEAGQWRTFRLPKASYSHDALHGWYTEWPRIRELAPGQCLMHMHGMFYHFPKTFSLANTEGLAPISTYLKMPVDYCYWREQLVMARDDASTMQNPLAGQSHSSLWFGQIPDLEKYGPPAGWGGPWVDDDLKKGEPSDPFLVAGFTRRVLHLKHQTPKEIEFRIEADEKTLVTLRVPARSYIYYLLPPQVEADWVRLIPNRAVTAATAYFHLGNGPAKADPALFKSLADIDSPGASSDGIIKPADGDARTLLFAANSYDSAGAIRHSGLYQMNGALRLEPLEQPERAKVLRDKYGVSGPGFSIDAASVIVTESGRRYRLPRSTPPGAAYDQPFASGWPRGKREVVTERFLLNVHGTFYELPRADAGGLARLRPVATHNKRISDFCRWRGLLVLAGLKNPAGPAPDEHCYAGSDGQCALWLGDVDDLWRLGPPRGFGGPWKDTLVPANAPSDPYLMAGYDRKVLEISHTEKVPVIVTVEVDFLADGSWSEYARFPVPPGQTLKHVFPLGYSAHWVRLRADRPSTLTALFTYEPAG